MSKEDEMVDVDSRVRALTIVHQEKVKGLLKSISSLQEENRLLRASSKEHRRSGYIRALQKQVRERELAVDVLKKYVEEVTDMNRLEVEEFVAKRTVGGPKRFRPKSREELAVELAALTRECEMKTAKIKALKSKQKKDKEHLDQTTATRSVSPMRPSTTLPSVRRTQATDKSASLTSAWGPPTLPPVISSGPTPEQLERMLEERDAALRRVERERLELEGEIRRLRSAEEGVRRLASRHAAAREELAVLRRELEKRRREDLEEEEEEEDFEGGDETIGKSGKIEKSGKTEKSSLHYNKRRLRSELEEMRERALRAEQRFSAASREWDASSAADAQRLSEAVEKAEALRGQVEALREAVETHRRRADAAERRAEAAEKRAEVFENRAGSTDEAARQRYERLEEELRDERSSREQDRRRAARAETDAATLRARLDEAENRAGAKAERIAELETRLDDAVRTAENATQQLADERQKTETSSSTERKLAAAKALVRDEKRRADRAEEKLRSLTQEFQDMQSSFEHLQQAHDQLETEYHTLQENAGISYGGGGVHPTPPQEQEQEDETAEKYNDKISYGGGTHLDDDDETTKKYDDDETTKTYDDHSKLLRLAMRELHSLDQAAKDWDAQVVSDTALAGGWSELDADHGDSSSSSSSAADHQQRGSESARARMAVAEKLASAASAARKAVASASSHSELRRTIAVLQQQVDHLRSDGLHLVEYIRQLQHLLPTASIPPEPKDAIQTFEEKSEEDIQREHQAALKIQTTYKMAKVNKWISDEQ